MIMYVPLHILLLSQLSEYPPASYFLLNFTCTNRSDKKCKTQLKQTWVSEVNDHGNLNHRISKVTRGWGSINFNSWLYDEMPYKAKRKYGSIFISFGIFPLRLILYINKLHIISILMFSIMIDMKSPPFWAKLKDVCWNDMIQAFHYYYFLFWKRKQNPNPQGLSMLPINILQNFTLKYKEISELNEYTVSLGNGSISVQCKRADLKRMVQIFERHRRRRVSTYCVLHGEWCSCLFPEIWQAIWEWGFKRYP